MLERKGGSLKAGSGKEREGGERAYHTSALKGGQVIERILRLSTGADSRHAGCQESRGVRPSEMRE